MQFLVDFIGRRGDNWRGGGVGIKNKYRMIIAIDVGKSLDKRNMVETNETNQVPAVMTYTTIRTIYDCDSTCCLHNMTWL